MKKIFLLAIVLLCATSPALRAQETSDSTRTPGRVAGDKQVKTTNTTLPAVKTRVIHRQLETTGRLDKLPKPGDPSPALEAGDINGKIVTLADFRGKYILVDVWATWCGPCLAEIPHLKALEEKMHGRNIAFISLSVDADKAKWEAHVKEQQLAGIQLHAGEDKSFTGPYDITGIPRFILIDRQGNFIDPYMKLRPSNPGLAPYLESLEGI
jgi:thiol-disulfide isomerase/thioredoxin